jgi:hypothetical protein
MHFSPHMTTALTCGLLATRLLPMPTVSTQDDVADHHRTSAVGELCEFDPDEVLLINGRVFLLS